VLSTWSSRPRPTRRGLVRVGQPTCKDSVLREPMSRSSLAIVADFGQSMTGLSCSACPGPRQPGSRSAWDPYLTRAGAGRVVTARQTGTTLALEAPNVGPGRSIPESFSGLRSGGRGLRPPHRLVCFHLPTKRDPLLDFASGVLASLPWHSFFLASFHFLLGSFRSLSR